MLGNRAWLFLVFLFILPLEIVTKTAREHGLASLPRFGTDYEADILPAVRSQITMDSPSGYDGQFYAQIALDPTLSDPRLSAAVDHLGYRARRIGLPALSYLLGLGNPKLILPAYSLLNLLFWIALACAMPRLVDLKSFQGRFTVVSILWSSGTLICIERALTDLPAATLSVWGAVLAQTQTSISLALLSYSALVKETNLLSFPAVLCSKRSANTENSLRRLVGLAALGCIPAAMWWGYVNSRVSAATSGVHNFTFPVKGIAEKIGLELEHLMVPLASETVPLASETFIELLAPIALGIQAIYFFLHRRFDCPWWRMGIGFALLYLVLNEPVWAEYRAYCRVLLPMTIAFNLMVGKCASSYRRTGWLVAGNAPLLMTVNDLIYVWLAAEGLSYLFRIRKSAPPN